MSEPLNVIARPKLLVVDDSRIVRATIRKHLAADYDLIEEANGEAGWTRLQNELDVQLLISDLSMPELDGLGLLARVRSTDNARIRHLPVIIISGEENEETRRDCVARGANDFITKSADRTEMLARVKANLELAQTRRTLEETRTAEAHKPTVDVETGVASSHLLALQLDQFHAFALRHGTPLALTLVQVDRFVELETQLGARLASQMLSMLAKLLQTKLRREDTFAHLDGPLFAIASPGGSLEGTKILSERLRQTVLGARINFRGEQLHLTSTLAVVSAPYDVTDSAESFFQLALDRLHGSPGAGSLMLPDVALASEPIPNLSEALAILQRGEAEKLHPHLPALMGSLLPLLELANRELQLRWDLAALQRVK